MTDNMTGPELFADSLSHLRDVIDPPSSDQDNALLLGIAQVRATHALTAAVTMLGTMFAASHGMRSREAEVWAEVIPAPPLVKCWGTETRRPECADRHTEDCDYADPPPEPKHVLLPVGTRVLVSDWERDDDDVLRLMNPVTGRISGYDMHRSKYQWQREYGPGHYASHDQWAFVDNRVIVHPDGPVCPEPLKPVKEEPTGPVLYVQRFTGKQGRALKLETRGGKLKALVQWFAPGVRPVWVELSVLKIIAENEVLRCENGQTGDECGSGENQCELCLAAEDAEAEEIEESTGLR